MKINFITWTITYPKQQRKCYTYWQGFESKGIIINCSVHSKVNDFTTPVLCTTTQYVHNVIGTYRSWHQTFNESKEQLRWHEDIMKENLHNFEYENRCSVLDFRNNRHFCRSKQRISWDSYLERFFSQSGEQMCSEGLVSAILASCCTGFRVLNSSYTKNLLRIVQSPRNWNDLPLPSRGEETPRRLGQLDGPLFHYYLMPPPL